MKYPKSVWVPFVVGQKPINYPRRAFVEDPNDEHPTSTYKIKRYHLHPGNEVARLKRENAMMRRWLKIYVQQLHCWLSDEIRAKMPGLFAGGKKGK